MNPASSRVGLGLDAGGTQTRWALASAAGELLAQGQAEGLTGLQMLSPEGRRALQVTFADIAGQALSHAGVSAVCAGLTGFDGDTAEPLVNMMAGAFVVPASAVRLFNDIELACRTAFEPGQGVLVYGGTGSVAAFVDAQDRLHRAGGHGGLIDDGGSGYWIAREALRMVWRAEDEAPGAWRQSLLAQRLFDAVGGSDWSHTRQWVYGASRGQLGALALAVAAAAHEGDAQALTLLQAAGRELARLGQVLLRRCGTRPLALAGRVFELHPAVEEALRAALAGHEVRPREPLQPHVAAARLAARLAPGVAAGVAAGALAGPPGQGQP